MNIRALEGHEILDAENLIREVFFSSSQLGLSTSAANTYLNRILKKSSQLSYIGIYERDLCAVLGYDADTFQLVSIYVREEMQGKGLGKQLLQEYNRIARELGAAKLSTAALDSVVTFFEENGYEPAGNRMVVTGIPSILMENLRDRDMLGMDVHVTIDHPLGSIHPDCADEEYACNCGYVNFHDNAQEVYVVGPEEPLDHFDGVVVGIVYRSDSCQSRWIVCEDESYDPNQVINSIGFQEQYHDTRILWK